MFMFADELLSLVGITEPLGVPFFLEFIDLAGDMFMVYLNIYFLIPRFFLKGKVVTYILLTFLTITAVSFLNYWIWIGGALEGTGLLEPDYYLYEEGEKPAFFNFWISNLWSNTGIVGLAVAFKLFEESYLSSQKLQALREDKLKTELAYLKTQVNPHFLFNTLNNMYVMARKQNENLPSTIMQLSDLLRYQLYETEEDTVPLHKEIDYLKNYLKLEQLRRQHLKLDFEVKGNPSMTKVRPLILLPYIENAFKYSNSGTGSDYIKIVIDAKEDSLEFAVENTKGSLHRREVGGIGLANAQRRLDLAYDGKYDLQINETEDRFIVNLKLNTK